MKTAFAGISALMLVLASAFALAQAPAAPPPVAPPPAGAPPAVPPSNAGTPMVNPPQQGTTVPRDANGNALPQSNPAQTNSGQTGGGYAAGATTAASAATIVPFAMLDRDKAGAIKMDQARGDPWLSQHFVDCDANHNEEVTQSEYEKCTGH
jgi:hypothetical protein